MKRFLQRPMVLSFSCGIIGIVFIWAGWVKFWDPQSFSDSIFTYHALPDSWIAPMTLGLPIFEIILGTLLLTGLQRRTASFGLIVLMLVFLLAFVSATVRGIQVDCGCFGRSHESWMTNPWIFISRDVLILLGCLWIYTRCLRRSQE